MEEGKKKLKPHTKPEPLDTLASKFLADSNWGVVVSDYQTQAKKDSKFVYRAYFPDVTDGKFEMHFSEDEGKRYKFKILSKRLDTLSKIDFNPIATAKNKLPSGSRISEVKFDKVEDYFTYEFYYMRKEDTKSVSIVFEAKEYEGYKPTDLVVFVFREE